MRTLLLLALAACATSPTPAPKGGPRGLRASDHLDRARDHDELARDHRTLPTAPMMTPGSLETATPAPWLRTWDTSAEHERLARIHRSEAAGIQAAYDEACRDRSGTDVTVSPLTRFGGTSWPTRTGVIVYLDKVESPDALLTDLRCHRAWMMLAPAGMDDCALDLPGLVLDARGDRDGVTLVITVSAPKLVPELQRRVAKQLEDRAAHAH